MGDLPTQYASQQAAGGVGNADACLIFIWPPPGDWDLGQLGLASEYSVQPDELPQPSPAHQMQPYFRGCHSPVTCTHSQVPQIGSCSRSCSAPSPAPGAAAPGPPAPDSRVPDSHSRATGTGAPVSPELQALEATVAGSRHSSTDRRGLGSAPGRQTASAGQTRFTRASPAAQPQDMDCSPPMGATVLPPLHQCDSMDADDPEPQTADSLTAYSLPFLEPSLWTSVHPSCQRTSEMSSCAEHSSQRRCPGQAIRCAAL